jgi:hypothetical protein
MFHDCVSRLHKFHGLGGCYNVVCDLKLQSCCCPLSFNTHTHTHTTLLLATALEVLWGVELPRLETLALGGQGYTAAQYKAAVEKVLDTDHHAVARRDMQVLLGRHEVGGAANEDEAAAAGKQVLWSLVEANAFSMRPYSVWAQDIPVEAFQHSKVIVTALSAMDLHCMERLRDDWCRRLEKVKQQQVHWLGRVGCI